MSNTSKIQKIPSLFFYLPNIIRLGTAVISMFRVKCFPAYPLLVREGFNGKQIYFVMELSIVGRWQTFSIKRERENQMMIRGF